jgi:hypothetical protein
MYKKAIIITCAILGIMGYSTVKINADELVVNERSSSNVINAIAEPESDLKLPSISLATEQNILAPTMACCSNTRLIPSSTWGGKLYTKYGDTSCEMHTYGVENQEQYDAIVNWTKNALNSIKFRNCQDWVYLQHYYNGGKSDSYSDPNAGGTYGAWKTTNADVIAKIKNNTLTRQEAENLMIYKSAINHVFNKIGTLTEASVGGISAYTTIFDKIDMSYGRAYTESLVGDILGFNTMTAKGPVSGVYGNGWNFDSTTYIYAGGYWWYKGSVATVNKTNYPKFYFNEVYSAPTYNLHNYYSNFQ